MYIVKCTIKKAIYDSRYVITGNIVMEQKDTIEKY